SDGPCATFGITAPEVKVTACIDRKILERQQLARSHIDGKPFCNRSQVEDYGFKQRDGFPGGIKKNVPITDRVVKVEGGLHRTPCAVFTIEAGSFHSGADCWIECAAGFFRNGDRELHCLVQNGADRDRGSDFRRELREFAGSVEPGAAGLY